MSPGPLAPATCARWAACTLALLILPCTLHAAALLLRPAHLWTAGEPLHSGWAVLIDGNHIRAAGPAAALSAPADATVIDLPGATLLPGLMMLPQLTSASAVSNCGAMSSAISPVRLSYTSAQRASSSAASKSSAPAAPLTMK